MRLRILAGGVGAVAAIGLLIAPNGANAESARAADSKIDNSQTEQAAADALSEWRDVHSFPGYLTYSIEQSALVVYGGLPISADPQNELDALSSKFDVQIRYVQTVADGDTIAGQMQTAANLLSKATSLYSWLNLEKDGSTFTVGLADDEHSDSIEAVATSIVQKVIPGSRVAFSWSKTYATTVDFDGRFSDSNPWKGGSAIYSVSGGVGELCTGFRAQRNSDLNYVMVTANHCHVGSSAFYSLNENGTDPQMGTWGYANPNSTVDVGYLNQLVGGGFSNLIYYGSYFATTSRAVLGGYDAGYNTRVYSDGSLSGQSTQRVVNTSKMIGTEGPYMVQENYMPDDLSKRVGKGDSGGPVYSVNSNGNTIVRGAVKGSNPGSATGPCDQGTDEFTTDRVCSHQSVFIPSDLIETDLGVTIK